MTYIPEGPEGEKIKKELIDKFFPLPDFKEEEHPFVKSKVDVVNTTYQDFEDKLFDNIANTTFTRLKPVICPLCGNIECSCKKCVCGNESCLGCNKNEEEEYGTY